MPHYMLNYALPSIISIIFEHNLKCTNTSTMQGASILDICNEYHKSKESYSLYLYYFWKTSRYVTKILRIVGKYLSAI